MKWRIPCNVVLEQKSSAIAFENSNSNQFRIFSISRSTYIKCNFFFRGQNFPSSRIVVQIIRKWSIHLLSWIKNYLIKYSKINLFFEEWYRFVVRRKESMFNLVNNFSTVLFKRYCCTANLNWICWNFICSQIEHVSMSWHQLLY